MRRPCQRLVHDRLRQDARHVALDQKEYQKRYDELATRYDGVKAEHDKVAGQIATMYLVIHTATK